MENILNLRRNSKSWGVTIYPWRLYSDIIASKKSAHTHNLSQGHTTSKEQNSSTPYTFQCKITLQEGSRLSC